MVGGVRLSCATLVRVILLSAAFLGSLAPYRGFAEDSNQLPGKATRIYPPAAHATPTKEHAKAFAYSHTHLQRRIRTRDLEAGHHRPLRAVKVYPICRWSGDLSPKINEGDRQAPEGFYTITPGLMNPNSNYYLAINTGFPNGYDRANDRHGGFLMIYGDCSSRGCYAMTDEQIGEIYSLARESFLGGQPSFQPAPPPNSGKNHYLKRLNHASRSAPWKYSRATTGGRHGRFRITRRGRERYPAKLSSNRAIGRK